MVLNGITLNQSGLGGFLFSPCYDIRMKFEAFQTWVRSFYATKRFSSDRYDIQVLSPGAGLFRPEEAPIEIRYVLGKQPEWLMSLEHLFERGYGIGIRTIARTPEHVLSATKTISDASVRGTIEPWLTRLIRKEEIPVFGEMELHSHYEQGMNLFDEAHIVLSSRHTMKHFILVDLDERGIEDRDWQFVADMNRELHPLSEEYLIRSIHRDLKSNAPNMRRLLASIVFLNGPIAQLLEWWVRGVGVLYAAVADDVMRESIELHSLRGSGFTWRQLWKRSRITIPLLVFAVWLSLKVPGYLDLGEAFRAGLIFGIASVLIPFSNILERLLILRNDFHELSREGKIAKEEDGSPSKHVWNELSIRSDDRGIALGILLTPFAAALLFSWFPTLTGNGWFLGAVATLEYVIAWLCVIVIRACFARWFSRDMFLALREPS